MAGHRIIRTAASWVYQIGLIILITLLISILVIQTYDINDVSMEPTFDSRGNRVLVFLTPYLFQVVPGPGEIVIIDSRVERTRTITDRIKESPLPALFIENEREHMWVKRVIGLPGDTIESRQGQIYRNGELLAEKYLDEKMVTDIEPVTVADGHIYVMGDNRNRSSDSRLIGPIPLTNIQGRVVLRIFPFDKIDAY